ncbi:hypothetical protein HRG84_20490 [Flavisolibacter sp. BT320]|nr:hypothetical protein [Flavisolibacter longurius]
MNVKEDIQGDHLFVPFLPAQGATGIDAIAQTMQSFGRNKIGHAPWATTYPSMPAVQFSIAYSNDNFYLQFDVEEDFIRAANGKANEPVYEDSCVEFFISLDGGDIYYNFEFNAIGTVLASYGASKTDRQFLPLSLVDQVESQSTIRRLAKSLVVSWQLTVVIPFTVFQNHPSLTLSGKICKANFYKCGDLLPEPHFLCWSPVHNETPNFHLPQYFGTLSFAVAEVNE